MRSRRSTGTSRMASNPFDQFDPPAAAKPAGANPFDQFDPAPAPPAAAPESHPIRDSAQFVAGSGVGLAEGAAGTVWDTLKAGSKLVVNGPGPVDVANYAYHWTTDPTGEWQKLKKRGSDMLEGAESYFEEGTSPPVAGPYGADPKQVSKFEAKMAPGVERFKKASPFDKGKMISKPIGAAAVGFFGPEAVSASFGKVTSLLGRTKALTAEARAASAQAATAKQSAQEAVLHEHPFLGDQTPPRTKLEKDSAIQAHNERKAAIQVELEAGIANASLKMKSAEESVRAQGEKELADLEAKLAAAEASTPEMHQVHQQAAQVAGLPPSYTLGGDRPPAGKMAREISAPAHEEAVQKQAAASEPWEVAKQHAKTLQDRGLYFETSESGESLLTELKRIIKGRVEGGEPAAGKAGTITADDVLRTTARDLYRGLRGEDIDGLHHPVDFGVVHTNIRRLRDIQYSSDEMGYGAVARRHAKELADAATKALEDYVGKENVPIDAYREASSDINRWQSRMGQSLVGREDLPYVNKGEAPHLTNDAKLPDVIASDIHQAQKLIGTEKVTQIMEAHLSDELSGLNSSDAVRAFMKKSPWIEKVPGMTEKAYKYLQSVDRSEGNISALKKTTAELQAHIKAAPGRIESEVKAIRSTGEKEMGDAHERASAAYVKAHDDMIARKSIASEVESFMNATTPERVASDADKLIKSLSNLPGTSQDQIRAVQEAARAAQADINASRSLAEREAKRKKAVAAIKHTLITATIGGAAGGAVIKTMGTLH